MEKNHRSLQCITHTKTRKICKEQSTPEDKSKPSKYFYPRRTIGIRTHKQSFVLQNNRNTPLCTLEHSKNPQDEKKNKPQKKIKSEIMKDIIHKEKENVTQKQKKHRWKETGILCFADICLLPTS